ncbi:flagellar biosynthesis protein FlhB [Bacillus mangrovi]|uniref:Flagellar biosynthetic protein FlhB n=1 Tax=Metabacillus mangrovi TaxID=1491830 RepID=A0A7X2S328_9BACI|nr:flagellar biosynthesis protein FlhB [Metabacillus mangrovi]MTH52759.1 flagellar biosynthesis protein FlhB [Metabacillus mangrovi]
MLRIQLDIQFFSGEKTEKATPKKRQDSRKKGQVAKSADVSMAINLLAVFFVLMVFGAFYRDRLIAFVRGTIQDYMMLPVTEKTVETLMVSVSIEAAYLMAPVLGAALAAGLISNYIQVGFLYSTEAIQPKFEKIDPIKGFKRIYSIRAVVEFLKSILKILFTASVTGAVIWMRLGDILRLPYLTVEQSLQFLGTLTVQMGLAAGCALLFLSLLDYMYQKYDFEKNIRMSKQDIKDEYKKSEGDPLIKSKIKQKQREMAMKRMMQDVPDADVIITNPTHFAVALKYDDSKMDAPYVVAKGADLVALKIKEIAGKHGIETIENKPLARALFAQVEIGQAVPEEFFKAIAEILAYIYRLKNTM